MNLPDIKSIAEEREIETRFYTSRQVSTFNDLLFF
jgi:hypothetical protein